MAFSLCLLGRGEEAEARAISGTPGAGFDDQAVKAHKTGDHGLAGIHAQRFAAMHIVELQSGQQCAKRVADARIAGFPAGRDIGHREIRCISSGLFQSQGTVARMSDRQRLDARCRNIDELAIQPLARGLAGCQAAGDQPALRLSGTTHIAHVAAGLCLADDEL